MIGVFDSGIGGLTVVRELFKQLPGFDVVYFGDTARTPYGNKSPATVRRYAVQDARFLVEKGAQVIVVACNTASALALESVKRAVKVPVIGVVRPAVAAAINQHQPKQVIGVIGTRGTVNSGIYDRLIKAKLPRAQIRSQACPLFVPLVEEGAVREPETALVAKRCLSSLRWPKVQALILGCTHYPFLKPIIQKTVGANVRLIDPAQATVQALAELLRQDAALGQRLGRRDRHRFYLSDRTDHYTALASRWLGRPVKIMAARAE
jgi:glutamate racemase